MRYPRDRIVEVPGPRCGTRVLTRAIPSREKQRTFPISTAQRSIGKRRKFPATWKLKIASAAGMLLAIELCNITGKEKLTVDAIKRGIYQDKLLRRRRETLSSLKRLEGENAGFREDRQLDWIEQATRENVTRLVDLLNQSYSNELDSIQAALGRIRTGTYGACTACHRPIEKRRLDSFPESAFCSRCRVTREAFEKYH